MSRLLFVVLCSWAALMVVAPASADELAFERDIRPLLKQHCFQCHGEEESPKGNLDLRLVRFLVKGGDSGSALVPRDHTASLLYQRIAADEMPPGDKKLTPSERQRIAAWIDQGARTSRPEPETLPRGEAFTDEERSHWAFQPIVRPEVPSAAQARSPLDAFIVARLQSKGLTPSPEADRATLIRRLSFDLLGLPPSPERVAQFVADSTPEAYERLVDELLNSPAYGERWARHWLDVAGYADSDGYAAKDDERKWAWKYRDYVIRAFNEDKPWDQFVVEQLAGDELLAPPYTNLSSEAAEKLIATGFLRMGPDGTGDGSVDQNVARNEVMAETIKIVSTSLLGLTVGCAQCHAHRYDPISQSDYYRMRSIFEPAYDWNHWRAPNARLVSQWSDATRERASEADRALKEIQQQRTEALDKIVDDTFEQELAKLPEDIQTQAREARKTAAKDRTDEHQQLIKEYPFLNVDRGSVYLYLSDRLRGFNKEWDDKTEAAKTLRPADDLIHCLTEIPGQAPTAKLFARGDYQQPREDVPPGELSVLNLSVSIPVKDEAIPTTGRRLAYARNLTSEQHPLVARVLVNRIWLHHFGRGLVATPGDFGVLGQRPSHPELLDWLAAEFVHSGWQLKSLQRLIVTSATYRQTSARRDDLDAIDADNHWLGRMPVRRLEAEVIRDSLLQLAGRLSDKQFGVPVPITPDDVGQVVVGVDTRDSAGRPTGKVIPLGEEEYRRSVYVTVRRTLPLGMLEPFDVPVMAPNCEQRALSTVAPQSLLLMNNAFVVDQALAMAERIRSEAGDDPAAQFDRAWMLIFSRSPEPAEWEQGLTYLREQIQYLTAHPAPVPPKQPAKDAATLALATLCQALMGSIGFLYVD
ncbi:MAG: PSD1 and planctomycete cytochrome C domain-containing protein [Planctomycetaceae bacterium]|nr:PSD1 and planctomycete cytochrome C domain-containing protein [Planctomycetaceae bacterium]